jgi:hypothetical protein
MSLLVEEEEEEEEEEEKMMMKKICDFILHYLLLELNNSHRIYSVLLHRKSVGLILLLRVIICAIVAGIRARGWNLIQARMRDLKSHLKYN